MSEPPPEGGSAPRPAGAKRTAHLRIAFTVYAIVLFVATHWPGLKIEGAPVPRPDLLIHLVAFAVWGTLAHASAFFGPRFSLENTAYTLLAGLLYAAADEGLQAIPALNRHATMDDFLANAAGLAIAAGLFRALGARRADSR
ncbi:MAG: hypothetical protein AAGG07_00360 [Planctomycetota bacterium]